MRFSVSSFTSQIFVISASPAYRAIRPLTACCTRDPAAPLATLCTIRTTQDRTPTEAHSSNALLRSDASTRLQLRRAFAGTDRLAVSLVKPCILQPFVALLYPQCMIGVIFVPSTAVFSRAAAA